MSGSGLIRRYRRAGYAKVKPEYYKTPYGVHSEVHIYWAMSNATYIACKDTRLVYTPKYDANYVTLMHEIDAEWEGYTSCYPEGCWRIKNWRKNAVRVKNMLARCYGMFTVHSVAKWPNGDMTFPDHDKETHGYGGVAIDFPITYRKYLPMKKVAVTAISCGTCVVEFDGKAYPMVSKDVAPIGTVIGVTDDIVSVALGYLASHRPKPEAHLRASVPSDDPRHVEKLRRRLQETVEQFNREEPNLCRHAKSVKIAYK